jgi:serine/threonine-protein kinase
MEKAAGRADLPPTRPGEENPTAAEAAASPRQPAPRADTIALVDKVDAAREIPTKLAVAIIVVLSLLAGITAYFVRSASEPQAAPAASSGAPKPSSTVPFGVKKR